MDFGAGESVGAVFVFLELLEGGVDLCGELLLGEAFFEANFFETAAHGLCDLFFDILVHGCSLF